jgi:hypothetical protein
MLPIHQPNILIRREPFTMTDTKINAVGTQSDNNAVAEPLKLTKRIGSTNYVIAVHFSRTSTETVEDKLYRLIEREVENVA